MKINIENNEINHENNNAINIEMNNEINDDMNTVGLQRLDSENQGGFFDLLFFPDT